LHGEFMGDRVSLHLIIVYRIGVKLWGLCSWGLSLDKILLSETSLGFLKDRTSSYLSTCGGNFLL